ncbi:PAS domain-containing sensor histidine kinase [Methylobacterium sp. Leaf102]|uniref:ATP-binding protein n=1 Tax=Methylobacterium sp. Leaf102 TaxID=1736253 RepID=UPI0006FC0693|nr:ATP-binding protein [Methylobacterium sp. Leaf102]KQP22216.1 PAS domain-containing sensor histidine kinase [Methylobacterium sp. Leaf102]
MASPPPDDQAPNDRPDAAPQAYLAASRVPALLVEAGPDGERIVFANPAFLTLTGYGAEAVTGRSTHFLLGPDTDRAARIALATALTDTPPEGVELLAYTRAGAAFWAQILVAPVPGTDRRLVQIVDVSRRRDAEGALSLSRQREALGLLTNSVAHEFNNFLQILIGYIDGLKRRLSDRDEPFIQRAILRSTDAAERATILTRQLLAFSRRIAPDVRPVDLNALITEFGARMGPSLPVRISLDVRTTPGLACGLSNPRQVELALNHIVANACEAMPGAGRITIATFAVPVGDRALQRPGDGAVGITVTDTGHGMSPEMAARALAPFITSREAGRGTGLAIVHGLVKRQNGTVNLESKPGEGTVVRLVFPAVA